MEYVLVRSEDTVWLRLERIRAQNYIELSLLDIEEEDKKVGRWTKVSITLFKVKKSKMRELNILHTMHLILTRVPVFI